MSSLELNGSEWALDSSMNDLTKACEVSSISSDTKPNDSLLSSIKLVEFELDTIVAAKIIQLILKHSNTLLHLTLVECSGHVDLVLTVALTALPKLTTLRIATGGISSSTFDPYANALGVGLQHNRSLRHLILQSGSNVFFTISTQAALMLADGLGRNCILERFDLVGCRFDDSSSVPSLARGLRKHRFLKQFQMKSCFQPNGLALEDIATAQLILALGQNNCHLQHLDLTGNQCISAGIAAISELLEQTKLVTLNLSCQCIASNSTGRYGTHGEDEEVSAYSKMDLSLLVAALGRTITLERLELRCNKLTDMDMPYLAAALTHNTSLRYLGLASNKISNVGLSILASRIPCMRGLKQLVLTNNKYNSDDLAELARAMKENWSLESVALDAICCSPATRTVKASSPSQEIQYYADLNLAGRRYLHDRNSGKRPYPSALWALVLARSQALLLDKDNGKERQANILYSFLQNVLFPT